ncbi:MAG: lmo0937 family membrane protein [bacterium]|nr:lmo0937 family membrane protein [bacterium]
MLVALFVIFLALWLFGLIASYTFGGFLYLFLVVAIIMLIVRLMQRRTPVQP